MAKKRQRLSAEFKFRVACDALKEQKTLSFTTRLIDAGVQISIDGRGRVFDNIFIERLWRNVKYEHLYLCDYETIPAVTVGLVLSVLQHGTSASESGLSDTGRHSL